MPGIPQATYRLQLNPKGFTFQEAAEVVDYLWELGASHVYASPYLQAASGSTHGYDVVDPGRVNVELGGAAGHESFCRRVLEAGMGQILDIVPNHMAIKGAENHWWWDVLRLGRSSRYAGFFDVDWDPPEPRLAGKILLPFLGDHYGRALENGELQLERSDKGLVLRYHEHVFPLSPASMAELLIQASGQAGSEDLRKLGLKLAAVPDSPSLHRAGAENRDAHLGLLLEQLKMVLQADDQDRQALDELIKTVNMDADRLDAIMERQHYRLAFWRVVSRDLGYRRFFGINSLVALRMEDGEVFERCHRLVLEWLGRGLLDGLRIDHPDGLRDPGEYLQRLRSKAPSSWIVVEKILHPGEELPSSWPVAGTTGYDFMHLLGQILVDPNGEGPLSDFYARYTGETRSYAELARQKKLEVMQGLLGGDLSRLTERFIRVCERHRCHRDYTRHELRQALEAFIACLPVYRSYVQPGKGAPTERDARIIEEAAEQAASMQPELDKRLFDFLRRVLQLQAEGLAERDLILTLQQVSGPVAAKGLEDTAFYCFNRLVAFNEVGGDPGAFGCSLEVFHRAMQELAAKQPYGMLASSTHDTKRSEDVRARLLLLSELPAAWIEAVKRWSGQNEAYKTHGLPDRNTEYLFYQTLVGAWPMEAHRAEAYMLKAAREAATHTAWTRPDPDYEQGLRHFIHKAMSDKTFSADLESFVRPLIWPGRVNSLAQTLIKLTAPGIPDIYQGTELWDLSLVDPDNRRPVDFELRRRLLVEIKGLSLEDILERQDEGLPKLWLIKQALQLRGRRPELFTGSEYTPLWAEGTHQDHVLAFCRGQQTVSVVPRLCLNLERGWEATYLPVPPGIWQNVLDGREVRGGWRRLDDLLDAFPVALLVRTDG